ncbi:MAG: hypothetical protein L6W00_00175 [Lentisphaeria bacterium]|nr:MAG: hypothetical protein L6W00_00175 [Lentisphaeria bacterium]
MKLEYSPGKAIGHPDWLKSLILVELNVETASSNRKFSGMAEILDHLAETGVNGVWITPLHAGGHYGNHGIHTINKRLTGPGSDEECWNQVRQFVDECHKRNIRVFLDVISWGVREDAPLRREKPEWFTGEFKKEWDGWLFRLEQPGAERMVHPQSGAVHSPHRRRRVPLRLRPKFLQIRAPTAKPGLDC